MNVTIFESIHPSGVEKLNQFADVKFSLGSSTEDIFKNAQESDVIIIKSVTKVNRELIDACPNLKVIARAGTGLDNIDVEYARSMGKKVFHVPTGNTVSAAEFALMFILIGCKRLPDIQGFIQKNDFRRHLLEGRELSEQTVGLIGLGNVGIELARRLAPFKCRLVAWDPYSSHQEEFISLGGEVINSLDSIASESNIISLHCALNEDTKELINKEFISMCKRDLILVNTARGGLINERDLCGSLKVIRSMVYFADVLLDEPPFEKESHEHNYTNPLLHLSNALITPHVAASTVEAQRKIALNLVEQIKKTLG